MLAGKALHNAVKQYVEEYSIELGLLPKTIRNKRQGLNRFLKFLGDKPLTDSAVRLYILDMSKRGIMPASINAEVKYIKAFVRFLLRRRYIKRNIIEDVITPKIRKAPRHFIKEDEAEKVILIATEPSRFDNRFAKQGKKEMRLCLRFILRTGLRISEARNLRGCDLNLDADEPFFMVHSKGGDTEPMPLPLDMIDELRDKTDRDKLFPVREESCNIVLNRGCKALGIQHKITCHSLRHIFSLGRLRRREPLQLVSRALRHSSIKITDSFYSEFVLTDIAPVVNNSPIIQHGLSTETLFKRVENAIDQTVIPSDSRIEVTKERSEGELVIRVKVKNGIMSE